MKQFYKVLILTAFILPFACEAKVSARGNKPYVVNLDNCHELRNPKKPFILVLRKGEMIQASVVECIQRTGLQSASFYGIGAVENPEIGAYSNRRLGYATKSFRGLFELASMNGFITISSKRATVAHIHCVIGDSTLKAYAGHLIDAAVGVTVEITIIPMPGPVYREHNEEFNLDFIDPTQT